MTEPLDFSRIRRYPLKERKNLVRADIFGKPLSPNGHYAEFLESLPDILRAKDLKEIVRRTVDASLNGKEILLAIGAHQVKIGMTPFIQRLIDERLVTAVAMNGAGIIHDTELALIGETSEDVAETIQDGSFGMAQETGEFINEAIAQGARDSSGLGASVGRKIAEEELPHRQHSLACYCHEKGIPLTVHVAYGTDIIHMHPNADGALTGKATEIDFRKLAAVVAKLEAGVVMNVGSAVILPEVFLKCLSAARNLGHTVRSFTAVNLDMVQHYRPHENVVRRPTQPEGRGYALTGNLEILFPLLTYCLLDAKHARGG